MRALCGALSIILLASSTGCVTGFDRAKVRHGEVAPGMTRAQVIDRLGKPDEFWPEPDTDTSEFWKYRYDHNAGYWLVVCSGGTVAVLTMGLAAVLLFPPFAMWQSSHGGAGHFILRFGADETVIWVSSAVDEMKKNK